MPFLFWMPMLVFSGLWQLAQDHAQSVTRPGEASE